MSQSLSRVYPDDRVNDRLAFAARRCSDLLGLNDGDLAGAIPRERQALLQEVFFHLGAATEFLLQEVNHKRQLAIQAEQVTIGKICATLVPSDPVRPLAVALHPNTRKVPFPSDPYSDDGMHYRIVLYRNWVTHIRHNPLFFRLGAAASLLLDPRLPPDNGDNASRLSIHDELKRFLTITTDKCQDVLALL